MQQTAYIKIRFIGEGSRLTPHIVDMCDRINIEGYLFTIYINKVFDSIDHEFILAVLKKRFWLNSWSLGLRHY